MTEGQPVAFVIMPFGEGFDEVYDLFVAETLGETGYDVVRADDVRKQQNILKDIVTGIATADLIVADLTDNNPNVYYELGIAHGLRRPTVLLTQKLEELPFDLRSYRVIPYSTHFAEIRIAKDQLREVAHGAREGRLTFGSPVTDFLGGVEPLISANAQTSTEGAGLLDRLVELEDGFQALVKLLAEHAQDTERIGTQTTEATQRFKAAVNGKDVRAARAIIMNLGQRVKEYVDKLRDRNQRYASHLSETRTALEFVVRAHSPTSPEHIDQLRSFLNAVAQAEKNAVGGRAATSRLADSFRNLPNMERTFSRAGARAVQELERFNDNIDQTVAMMARAREIGETKLGAIVSPDNGSQSKPPETQ